MSRQLTVYSSPDRPGLLIAHDRRGWWLIDLDAGTWQRHRGQARLEPVKLTTDLLDQIEALRPADQGGRPEVGPVIQARIPPALLAKLDAYAAGQGTSRAETVRQLVERALEQAVPAKS
jgi:hypothetical protein